MSEKNCPVGGLGRCSPPDYLSSLDFQEVARILSFFGFSSIFSTGWKCWHLGLILPNSSEFISVSAL